jgi:nicotinate-nucleotide adenylyltransferase
LPAPERIGILGGTFDPPHVGHLAAAVACREALHLDRLLLVVANHPWQKVEGRVITAAEDRFAMVAAAAEGIDGVEASRLEIDRGGPSYTVETVEDLIGLARGAGLPDPDISVVVGADLVASLPTWERADDLRRLVTLVIVSRPGNEGVGDPDGWRTARVPGVDVDVSSSRVRALLERGRSVAGLVPEPAIRYIGRRGLYAVRR